MRGSSRKSGEYDMLGCQTTRLGKLCIYNLHLYHFGQSATSPPPHPESSQLLVFNLLSYSIIRDPFLVFLVEKAGQSAGK